MKKMTLKFIGRDDWGCPVFETEEGRILKDTNLGDGFLALCTTSGFDGEPDTSVHNIEKYKDVEFEIVGMEDEPTKEERFNYMMLGRLQSDCKYYLGNGGRNEKNLWAQGEREQIAEMKKLWNSFADDKKPEWLTWDEILDYENKMMV